MTLKFRHKVFFTFLAGSLLMVICMLVIGTYLGHRNFEKYVAGVEREKLKELAAALSQEYRKGGSWDVTVRNWEQWLRWTHFGPEVPPGPPAIGGLPFPPSPPPPVPEMGRHPREGGPPLMGKHSHPPGPPPEHRSIVPRIALFDTEKHSLTLTDPTSADGYSLVPVTLDDETVGWLGAREMERPAHPLDVEFLRQQSEMLYWTGGLALIVAALVTALLSHHILKPVKVLTEGTRALNSRQFDTRIQVRSRDELGQLASDFNAMAATLERYEQTRRQWLADISHELRTPLAILRGEIEAMQDGVREVTAEALESLHCEVTHLSRIVQDLYDISLMESRAYGGERYPVSPFEVLDDTIKIYRTRMEHKGMRIETNLEGMRHVTIAADADRLRQLFSNLLENSLRYADSPGVLSIFHELSSDSLSLHFQDSGPGVPQESLARLFDRLYRVDAARSRTRGGSGLGLAICKGIVESFGGRIEASRGISGGLRMTMAFPLPSGERGQGPSVEKRNGW